MHLLCLPNVLLMNSITIVLIIQFVNSGDFSLPDIDWNNITIKSYQYPRSMSLEFLKLHVLCDLEQMLSTPYRSNNIIDLFFTTHPSQIDKCVSIPGVGDHDAVVLEISTTSQCSKPIKRKIMSWNKANLSSLRYVLTCFVHTLFFNLSLMQIHVGQC